MTPISRSEAEERLRQANRLLMLAEPFVREAREIPRLHDAADAWIRAVVDWPLPAEIHE